MAKSTVESSPEVVVDLTEEVMRVLHVDDEAGFLKAAKQILEMQGAFQVETASSVKEAMEIMKEKTFDVVVSDYVMPGKSGLDFLKELRDSGNDIPFIMFTGKGREEVAIKALNLGADHYINKIGKPETVYYELAHGIRQAVERKTADEALRESESKSRTLLENLPQKIFFKDTNSVYVSCNENYARDLKIKSKEITGKTDYDFHPEELAEKYRADDKRILESGKTEDIEEEYIQDGQKVFVHTVKTPVKDKNGNVAGILGIFWDITERKKAEEDVKWKTEDLQLINSLNAAINRGGNLPEVERMRIELLSKATKRLFSCHGVTIYLLSEDKKHLVMQNMSLPPTMVKRLEKLIGFKIPQAEIILKPSSLYLKALEQGEPQLVNDPATIQRLIAEFADSIKLPGKLLRRMAERIIPQIHKILGIQSVINVPLVSEGATIGLMDVSRSEPFTGSDVERIKVISGQLTAAINACMHERRLKENEAKMRSFMEAATDIFCIFDSELNFSYITERGIKTFFPPATKKDDIIGQNVLDVIPNVKETGRYNKYMEVIKTGKPFFAEDLVPHPKFGNKHLTVKAFRIEEGMGVIISDVTERKKAEESLNETLEKMQVLNEKLGVVGKLTRHDVRNKLTTVANNIYMAKQRLTGDHETLEHLSEIESAVEQVEKIFEFARIYEKLGMEELAYMDVEKSLREAVMLFSDLHCAKVVNDCHGLTVLADSLLRQLLYNLIDNSLKHGKNVSRIRVSHQEAGKDKLKLIYEDDGIGIPKAEKEKIFREGYGKGSGYGLYLIRKMCEVYSWTIRETGKQGKGAQFTLTIPKMNENGKIAYRLH